MLSSSSRNHVDSTLIFELAWLPSNSNNVYVIRVYQNSWNDPSRDRMPWKSRVEFLDCFSSLVGVNARPLSRFVDGMMHNGGRGSGKWLIDDSIRKYEGWLISAGPLFFAPAPLSAIAEYRSSIIRVARLSNLFPQLKFRGKKNRGRNVLINRFRPSHRPTNLSSPIETSWYKKKYLKNWKIIGIVHAQFRQVVFVIETLLSSARIYPNWIQRVWIPLFTAFLNTASMKKIGEVSGATCSRENFTSIRASLRRSVFQKRSRRKPGCRLVDPLPYSGYIYKSNVIVPKLHHSFHHTTFQRPPYPPFLINRYKIRRFLLRYRCPVANIATSWLVQTSLKPD